ncbi:hypothetical protein CRYUN_Cryun20dG0067600 [Craigia yunnanensis]
MIMVLHSNCSRDEVESLGEMEECFLRQLDENKNVTNSFLKEPADELQRDHASPRSCSGCNVESGVSFTDSKNENSALSTSDGEDSGASDGLKAQDHGICTKSLAEGCENTDDVEMIDKLVEST